jgi:hypothetical protein
MTLKELAKHRSGAHGAVGRALAKLKHLKDKGVNSQYLRGAIEILTEYRRECIVCLTPIRSHASFMVRKPVWREVVGEPNVCVCLPCFERFLGREVEIDDLQKDKNGAHLPINYHLLEDPEPEHLTETEEQKAQRIRDTENHFAGILDKLLTEEQKRLLDENPEGHRAGYGLRSNMPGRTLPKHRKKK